MRQISAVCILEDERCLSFGKIVGAIALGLYGVLFPIDGSGLIDGQWIDAEGTAEQRGHPTEFFLFWRVVRFLKVLGSMAVAYMDQDFRLGVRLEDAFDEIFGLNRFSVPMLSVTESVDGNSVHS